MEKSKNSGIFSIPPGRDVYGELTFAGINTTLYLRDKEFFSIGKFQDQCIKGVLHDLTKVTLIKCITKSDLCSHSRGKETYYSSTVFPHFVVSGEKHITPLDKAVSEVSIVIDDATTLFNDFEAFGSLIDSTPFIEQIVRANKFSPNVTIGPEPQIQYFTGKREIFSAETVVGNISATHAPSSDFGGPDGICIKNTIYVTTTFRMPVTFDEAVEHTLVLLILFAILVGRPQNLVKMDIAIGGEDDYRNYHQVYWSLPPQRETQSEEGKPHPSSLLIDVVREPTEFSRILANWLERRNDWQDARGRFSESFSNQRTYSVDRLVGAANMFDILPSSAVPDGIQLSEELQTAKASCYAIWKRLPQSPERDSVLSSLGRLGKCTLKQKIRYRSQHLSDSFPDINLVTDEAVNCRNHYVHGSEPRVDYSNNFAVIVFFTNTLEFVFATSDLTEAGWNFSTWRENTSGIFHPFAEYLTNYDRNLKKLKVLLNSK